MLREGGRLKREEGRGTDEAGKEADNKRTPSPTPTTHTHLGTVHFVTRAIGPSLLALALSLSRNFGPKGEQVVVMLKRHDGWMDGWMVG